jgi:hypothetical protein
LRDLRGEEEKKKLLGAFLEERRAHEVKGLRRSHCLGASLHGEVFHGGLGTILSRGAF